MNGFPDPKMCSRCGARPRQRDMFCEVCMRQVRAEVAAQSEGEFLEQEVCSVCGPLPEGRHLWGWLDLSISQLPDMRETVYACSALHMLMALARLIAEIDDSVSGRKPLLDADGGEHWLTDMYTPAGPRQGAPP